MERYLVIAHDNSYQVAFSTLEGAEQHAKEEAIAWGITLYVFRFESKWEGVQHDERQNQQTARLG